MKNNFNYNYISFNIWLNSFCNGQKLYKKQNSILFRRKK